MKQHNRVGPLALMARTSNPSVINIASWHWRSSLTWSWILSAQKQEIAYPKPWAVRNRIAIGAGLGSLVGFHTCRTNEGRQWCASLFWLTLMWHRQRPIFAGEHQ